MSSNEDKSSELERVINASRPITDTLRTAVLSYAAGVAAGRNSGSQLSHRRRLVVLSHSCSALAGSLLMIGALSMGALKLGSSQPNPAVAKDEAPQGAADRNPASKIVYPQADCRSSSSRVMTSVISPRLLDELQWPSNDENLPETIDNDQPMRPFNTRSKIF